MSGSYINIKLFDSFSCIGGECPLTCCKDWGNISWLEDEVQKVKNSNCSEHLSSLLNTSFKILIPENNVYTIEEVNGLCPLLDENGLCSIQKELGHDYLSRTCQTYPRFWVWNNNVDMQCLHNSCYQVLTGLMTEEDSVSLVQRPKKTKTDKVDFHDNPEKIKNYPALKYRNEIFMLLYETITDKSYSVETGIALGALAMQQISKFAEQGQADRIPEVIHAIRPQLKNKQQIEKLEAVKPNNALKIVLVGKHINTGSDYVFFHNDNGTPNAEEFEIGLQNFYKAIEGRDYALRNVIINLLFDTRMPCFSTEISLYENYCYFSFCVAMIKYVAAMTGFANQDIEFTFKKIVAKLSRTFSHTTTAIDRVLTSMKESNCTSPAYLLSLIK